METVLAFKPIVTPLELLIVVRRVPLFFLGARDSSADLATESAKLGAVVVAGMSPCAGPLFASNRVISWPASPRADDTPRLGV